MRVFEDHHTIELYKNTDLKKVTVSYTYSENSLFKKVTVLLQIEKQQTKNRLRNQK